MNKKTFSKAQIKELEKNPNIIRVSEHSITYHPEFKIKAVLDSLNGISPTMIFTESGFDLEIIGKDIPRKRIYNWRKIYDKDGELGLQTNIRGKAKAARPLQKELSVEEKLRRAEAKIKFLEAENDFLKKLEELERQALRKKRD